MMAKTGLMFLAERKHYLAVLVALALSALTGCCGHRVVGFEKYGERISSVNYLCVRELGSTGLTAALGVPPERGEDLERDKVALAEAQAAAPLGSTAREQAEAEEHLTPLAFDGVIGPRFRLEVLPGTSNLLQRAFDDTWVAAHQAKKLHFRQRPDPALKNSSFPSVHAAEGEVLGEILADLLPD